MTQGEPRPSVTVRKIQPQDFESVIAMMGRAFDDDPVMNHIARQDAHRSARIRRLLDVGLRAMTYPYGEPT